MYRPTASPFASRLARGISFGVLSLLVTVALGCGGSKGSKDSVSGKVTTGGQPVSGEIVFTFADGKTLSSPIGEGGKYSIPGAPKGEAKVSVKGMGGIAGPAKGMPDGPKGVDMPAAGGGGVPPPGKYAKADNGLTYTVKGGDETKDFDLTP